MSNAGIGLSQFAFVGTFIAAVKKTITGPRAEPPDHLKCAITQELFTDPVVLVQSGYTYDRRAIQRWLAQKFPPTDPTSNVELWCTDIVPNWSLRQAVDEWALANGARTLEAPVEAVRVTKDGRPTGRRSANATSAAALTHQYLQALHRSHPRHAACVVFLMTFTLGTITVTALTVAHSVGSAAAAALRHESIAWLCTGPVQNAAWWGGVLSFLWLAQNAGPPIEQGRGVAPERTPKAEHAALEKNIEDTSPSMTSSVRAEGHRDGGDANEDAWEFVGGKKKSGNTPRQNAESEKSNVSRVGGQQLERGATNGASEHVKTAHNDDQKRRQRQKQQQSARLEPSGWAAIVTGRLSPTDVSADAAAIAVTAQTVAVDNVIDSVHDVQLSPGSATSSEDKLSRMDSREVEGSQSPQSDRESQLISGARENAEVVGAGARALKGWASILGGSSAPESQVKDNIIDQGIKAEAVVETSPNKSEDTSGKAPVAPAASTWTGWGVSSPPPKVDLKATMEADAAAAAAAEPTQSSAVKKEVTRTDEKHRKQNGRKKKDVNGKKENKSAKQRQDGYRKDREKISRVKVTVSKPISPPPVDVSMDRPRAPLSSDVEDALAERLGRELIECAHMQYFTPTAQLLKKERRAVDVVIRAMNAIVQTLFPATGVEVFGSYPTRAWVPGSSNLDLSLELPEAISSRPDRRIEALHTLAMALRTNPWVMDVNVVPSSFRPLIRMSTHTAFFQPMPQQLTGKASAAFAEGVKAIVPPLSASSMDVNGTPPLPSGPRPGPPPYGVPGLGQNGFGLPLEVHISLKDGSHKGLSALRFVQAAEEQHGALAPLVCVQKAVLASKGLRGVYKGGLGSYALTMMALTSIQRSSCRGAASNADDASKTHDEAGKHSVTEATETRDAMYVGRAMLDFLKLYGHEADLSKDVISAHTGDASADWGILSGSLEKSNNAGAGCFGISGVQALFREQLEVLRNAADTKFDSDVPLLMQLIMLGGAKKFS
ncbi:hypothetical protein BE221DRAFT_148223 [Ostreococcus tauri]|uniref:U-box domain-containing protein n=1 Tax=Ostreococcus tauri TaxID=70448 RepID=A0A1Y5I5Z8_OSTTA|nr:hypothetical protein BE221DRAFT_148223 [Ostreococcus tauri]